LTHHVATAKRLPSAKHSLHSTDARTSTVFSDGHMLVSTDSCGISKTPRSNNPSLDVSFWGWCWLRSNRKPKAASGFPPRRTRCSYPKWVGVGFHLFRGAASSGRETIHSPPSVKGVVERDHQSIAQDHLFFLLPWGRLVNKVTPMGTKNGRVPHWHWAEDDPKSKGSPCWRRSTARDAFVLLRERGKGQPIFLIIRKGWDRRKLACFQVGPAVRNQEIFAGDDLDLGWRKRCPKVTSSPGRILAIGDRLAVSVATAKRLPSAKDSLLSTDAWTSKAFSDGHISQYWFVWN